MQNLQGTDANEEPQVLRKEKGESFQEEGVKPFLVSCDWVEADRLKSIL